MTNKAKQAAILTTVCVLALFVVLAGVGICRIYQLFSPPQDGPVADTALVEAPALISCLDLQRELNRLDPDLKLQEDGICDPATMAAWDEEVFNGYALELWPEEAK